MGKYTIGVDFGTLSARAVLVNVENGNEISSSAFDYPDKVIENFIPKTKIKLKENWALQNPNDYLLALEKTIKAVLKISKIKKEEIIGLAIDFTASTIVALDENNQPMCNNEKYYNNPHAWVKLWKHHAAQKYANELNILAEKKNAAWLKRYGGKISSEWMFPKILQVIREDLDFYKNIDNFLEATDWVTSILTGNIIRSTCVSGYKGIYHHKDGFVDNDFLKELDVNLDNIVGNKIKGELKNIGEKAGNLTNEWADKLGLSPNVIVAVGNVDAHVSSPAVKVLKPGQMLMIMGTSTCDILISEKEKYVPGMCGVAYNGSIPGYFAYESGQSAVGDIFAWFVDNFASRKIEEEAKEKNISIHNLLEEKASKLKVGESGLLAIDWFGGNRSILVDADVSGIIFGMNLSTKPWEIYRALIEATAFGKKVIIDNFIKHGIDINELFVCGGLPNKNKMLVQIYADILNMEIKIADSNHTPALGSAIFASVAAGYYKNIFDASNKMGKIKSESVKPILENVLKYEKIYQEFKKVHDTYGYDKNSIVKNLKKIKEV